MNIHMYVNKHTYMYVYVGTRVCVHVCVCMCECLCVCMYVCVSLSICVCVRARITLLFPLLSVLQVMVLLGRLLNIFPISMVINSCQKNKIDMKNQVCSCADFLCQTLSLYLRGRLTLFIAGHHVVFWAAWCHLLCLSAQFTVCKSECARHLHLGIDFFSPLLPPSPSSAWVVSCFVLVPVSVGLGNGAIYVRTSSEKHLLTNVHVLWQVIVLLSIVLLGGGTMPLLKILQVERSDSHIILSKTAEMVCLSWVFPEIVLESFFSWSVPFIHCQGVLFCCCCILFVLE